MYHNHVSLWYWTKWCHRLSTAAAESATCWWGQALPMFVLNCYTEHTCIDTHTHTRLTSLFSGTTQVSQYQKGKTNLDFTEARDSEWQWHPLGHMQVCISLQSDNHASTPPLSFLQAGCPSCRPTNSVKALKANTPVLNAQLTYCNSNTIVRCSKLA